MHENRARHHMEQRDRLLLAENTMIGAKISHDPARIATARKQYPPKNAVFFLHHACTKSHMSTNILIQNTGDEQIAAALYLI